MLMPDNIVVVKLSEFTTTPGPRLRGMGAFSGEEFREEFLIPALKKAKEEGKSLLIDLDGTCDISEGFLDEVFGTLAKTIFTDSFWPNTVMLKSEDKPNLKTLILDITVARIRGERDKKLIDKLAEKQQITAISKKSSRKRKKI